MPAIPVPSLVRTQADLARLAGVSAVTVHKALGGQSGVSERMRQKIQNLAVEHGYRINVSGRAMRTGRFGNIALVLSTVPGRSTVPGGLLTGIQATLDEKDTQLTVARLPDAKLASEGFVPKVLREWSVDGLLINYTDHIPPNMTRLIREHAVPSVWINTSQSADCVYPDDLGAARQATRLLLEQGHRHIAFVDYAHDLAADPEAHFSARARREGYEAEMAQAGLSASVVQDQIAPEAQLAAAERLLRSDARPTAALCYAGPDATALYVAALKLGLDVPADLSLISFGGQRVRAVGIPVDSMLLPEAAMGRTAVLMLQEKIEKPGGTLPPAKLPFTYQAGQTLSSCGV